MKFAVANQFFMIAHQAGIDYTNVLRAIREDYPRAQDLPGPGLRRRARACSRTRCSWPRSPPTTSRSASRRCRSTRACRRTSCRRSSGATARSTGETVGILGMAFKAESDDTRASLSFKLRKLLAWAGARVLCTDPFVVDDRLRPARGGHRPRARSSSSACRTRRTAACRSAPSATSSTSGAPSATGSGCEGPRHRRRRVHLRLPRPRAARARPRGRRRRRLQQVRPAHEVLRRAPGLPVRRGRRQGRGAADRARRRLRPGRRRGGDDRRDQLLPRVRLRPDRRERADPRGDLRRGDRRPARRVGSSGSSCSARRWSTSRRRSSRPRRAPS